MKAQLAVTEHELEKILSEAPFIQAYGFQLHSVANGECTIRVPQQFLHRTDVGSRFEQIRREGVTQGVTACRFGQIRSPRRLGLMIYTKSFPGWENFAAFLSHIQFVKNHQRKAKNSPP
jgi:hypothetical protein